MLIRLSRASADLVRMALAAALLAQTGGALAQPPPPVSPERTVAAASADLQPAALGVGSAHACVPGRQLACACPRGAWGAQRCLADGSGFGECLGCGESSAGTQAAAHPLTAQPSRGQRPPPASVFGINAQFGAAVDNASLAGSVGGRYRLNERWVFGVDGEYNPWFSFDKKQFRSGTINVYATVIKRYPVSRHVSLRTSGHIGVSVLLFNLIGAEAGSTGLYFAGTLVGFDYALGKNTYLILDPAQFAVPIPHLSGAPLAYRQYRISVGVQFGG